MYTKLFEVKAEKTLESVNAALLEMTGDSEWLYETMEEIVKAEKAGFLEFKDGTMSVFAEGV